MRANDLPDIDSSGDDDGPTHEYEVCDRLECRDPLTHLVVQRQDCLLGSGQFRRHFEVCEEHANRLGDTLDGVVLVRRLSQAPFRRLIADGGEREDPDPHWLVRARDAHARLAGDSQGETSGFNERESQEGSDE